MLSDKTEHHPMGETNKADEEFTLQVRDHQRYFDFARRTYRSSPGGEPTQLGRGLIDTIHDSTPKTYMDTSIIASQGE